MGEYKNPERLNCSSENTSFREEKFDLKYIAFSTKDILLNAQKYKWLFIFQKNYLTNVTLYLYFLNYKNNTQLQEGKGEGNKIAPKYYALNIFSFFSSSVIRSIPDIVLFGIFNPKVYYVSTSKIFTTVFIA